MATSASIVALAARAGTLFSGDSSPDPLIGRLSDDALELFYARELHAMVRDTLRPSISRARVTAKVPLHQVALRQQMGRPVDDGQEKALARAWDRSGRLRWEGLLHGTTTAARAPYWTEAMHLLTEVRNGLHTAQHGPATPNVRPIITLVDAWHNLPILMVQKGVRSIDPKRVGLEGRVMHALTRYAQQVVEQEAQALRNVADTASDGAPLDATPRRRTP